MDVAFGPQRGALRLEYVFHFFSPFRISLVSCPAVFSSLEVTPISDEPMSTKVLITFYLMSVGVLRPAVHNTLLNTGHMSVIRCTSRSVPPASTVDDLYC
ncbi:hypothetical protein MTO96_004973 [Rhipicephalus appendiculatus]